MTDKIGASIGRVFVFLCLVGLFGVTLHLAEAFARTLNVPTQYTTVQSAFDAAQPGDIILLAPGTYNEKTETKRGGTANARIIIDGQNAATLKKITLRHPYITIQKMRFAGMPVSHEGYVHLHHYAHYTIVQDCIIDLGYQKSTNAIRWEVTRIPPFGKGEVASHCLITRNDISHAKASYIISMAGDYNAFTYNYVHDVIQADFIGLFGRYNYIGYNTFSNNIQEGGLGWHSDFIQTFGNNCHGSQHHIIENNYIYKLIGGGMAQISGSMVPEISDWTFRNNIFHEAGTLMSITIPNVHIFNNLFYQNNKIGNNASGPLSFGSRYFPAGGNGCRGKEGTTYAHGAKVFNNIFLDNGCCDRTNAGWYAFAPELKDVAADYNYVGKSIHGVPYSPVNKNPKEKTVGDPGGWNVWKWWEPHGFNGGDPKFVNIAAGCEGDKSCNFHLQKGSMLIDSGLDLSAVWPDAKSQDGVSRPQGDRWDIGPFEY